MFNNNLMHLTLCSKDRSTFPGVEKSRHFTFSTIADLQIIKRQGLTIKDLFQLVCFDLEFNPPKCIRGDSWQIRVKEICYMAQINNQITEFSVKVPTPPRHKHYPPLEKINGTYQIYFYAEHTWAGDAGFERKYPSNPDARLRHFGKSNHPGIINDQLLKARFRTAQIYKLEK